MPTKTQCKAFLDDLTNLCRRHNLWLDGEDHSYLWIREKDRLIKRHLPPSRAGEWSPEPSYGIDEDEGIGEVYILFPRKNPEPTND